MRYAHILVLVGAVLAVAVPARADLESGIAAYKAERYREALRELLPLADAGNAMAQYYVGRMHYYGEGRESHDRLKREQDVRLGAFYFLMAAKQRLPQAEVAAGDRLYDLFLDDEDELIDVMDQSDLDMAHWFNMRAAKQGYPEAYLRLSTLYCEGHGVPWLPIQAEA